MTGGIELARGGLRATGVSSVPPVALIALGALSAGWLVYLVSLVAIGPGDHPLRDTVLYLVLMYAGAALILARGARGDGDRAVWLLLGAAQVCSASGDLLYLLLVAGHDAEAFPSIADAVYLAYYPLAIAAVVVFVTRRVRGIPRVVWGDAIMLALAVGGFVGAVFLAPLNGTLSGGPFAVVVGAAYPVGDTFVMLIAVVGMVLVGLRRSGALLLIAISMVVAAAADLWYWNMLATDLYVEGGVLDSLWPLSGLLLTMAAWVPGRNRTGAVASRRGLLVVPGATLVIATTTLTVGAVGDMPVLTVAMALTAMGGVLNRLTGTVRRTLELMDAQRDAVTDDLTGLMNRRGWTAEVERVLTDKPEDRDAALLHADLDGFKEVNDSLGHDAGDQVLRAVAERLAKAAAGADVLMGRLGGDEFAVFVPGACADVAEEVADRLRSALSLPFLVEGTAVALGVSIGISTAPHDGNELSVLLRRADIAMYRAKAEGLGVAVFDREIDMAGEDRLQRVAELRRAIATGELVLHFQPKITLATGEVEGVEALVRWERPGIGTVYPQGFLPLASSAGLMTDLTVWVLHSAAQQAARWRAVGIDLPIAVNVPAQAFSGTERPREMKNLLASYGLPGSALQVEITEQALLEDRERARIVLPALRALGVRSAIDDYGTGYSSLTYLRELDVDEVKIDRSFVLQLLLDDRSASIVRSTIDLVHALGLRVVAEGIEEASVAEALTAMGCDAAQGYHWTRPLPVADFESWFAAYCARSGERATDTWVGVDADVS
ncbi:bifunctional diguanylate cyclase/phosphodiesterase [Demequina sp. NBRC 110054]|uniref:putative bifunctional diguanylate cyclase/phosphodiesterase n=1 Tax=Demequina sp. NBRC 110054 TaxID=1570343 RepID=UPI000A040128|nr:EAL domain-containing protein [Demequina sp. NBRC 110054]